MRRPYARPSASRIGRLRPAGVCAGGQAHQARHARAAPHALLLCASAGAARATGPYRVSLASTPPTHHRGACGECDAFACAPRRARARARAQPRQACHCQPTDHPFTLSRWWRWLAVVDRGRCRRNFARRATVHSLPLRSRLRRSGLPSQPRATCRSRSFGWNPIPAR
jgi:hypothetical protein